jgi:hypothetical protein
MGARVVSEAGVGRTARQHQARAHAELFELQRYRLGECVHRRLARAVRGEQGQRLQRHTRRHVHDDAGPALAELRQHRLRQCDRAEGVGLEQLAYSRHRHQFGWGSRAEARVVDEDVDRARRLDGLANALRIRDVERQHAQAV